MFAEVGIKVPQIVLHSNVERAVSGQSFKLTSPRFVVCSFYFYFLNFY